MPERVGQALYNMIYHQCFPDPSSAPKIEFAKAQVADHLWNMSNAEFARLLVTAIRRSKVPMQERQHFADEGLQA